MSPASSPGMVLDAIQRVKASAPDFCTNIFPLQNRLQNWIDHGELQLELRDGAAFFFRKDRDLWHLYFSAASLEVLRREARSLASLRELPMTADIVGNAAAVGWVIDALTAGGFRRYRHLQRMARPNRALPGGGRAREVSMEFAGLSDGPAVLELLDASFDRFADQLPASWEIDAALSQRQILAVKCAGKLAAILFFETQGFTSTLRYWAVAEAFQAKRVGSSLMRHYFESHSAVRRFVLWVVADHRNAVEKYEHYGYQADGLIDHVLVNAMIPA